ncbi:MAG: AmmeMemoRadiSam system protein B [Candidatus Wallbacteria bacterium]|nr:AmmeMemoRadiSam system protein B [Candidatus Wallbacteria bacterium]
MRQPVVAGKFYPGNPKELDKMVADFFRNARETEGSAWGIITPHAGYVFSGAAAARAFSAFGEQKFDILVLLGPNHTGYGGDVSMSDEPWETLLGNLDVSSEMLEFMQKKGWKIDKAAHKFEHSLEVQLPFILKKFEKTPKILPICIREHDFEICRKLALDLFDYDTAHPDLNIGYVASSDFSHYLKPEIVKKRDMPAIDRITDGDAEGFYQLVAEEGLTICGVLPITVLLCLQEHKGGSAELLCYTHSGEAYPMPDVVAYAAIGFYP